MNDNCVPVDDFVEAVRKEILGEGAFCTSDFLLLLRVLTTQYKPRPNSTDTACARTAELAGRLIRLVDEEYADPCLSLADLSHKLNVSERQLARLFHSYAGKSFRQYLIDLRMKAAAELLTGSSLDVKTIAGRVGYNYPSNFVKYFRLHVGCTPLEFRAGCCN